MQPSRCSRSASSAGSPAAIGRIAASSGQARIGSITQLLLDLGTAVPDLLQDPRGINIDDTGLDPQLHGDLRRGPAVDQPLLEARPDRRGDPRPDPGQDDLQGPFAVAP